MVNLLSQTLNFIIYMKLQCKFYFLRLNLESNFIVIKQYCLALIELLCLPSHQFSLLQMLFYHYQLAPFVSLSTDFHIVITQESNSFPVFSHQLLIIA